MTASAAKKRVTKRVAIAIIAFVSVATPAAAGVLITNYIRTNVIAVPPCFVKVAGIDTTAYGTPGALAGTGPYVAFDAAPTLSSGGISLINEAVTIRGFSGDRAKYVDVVRYQNNCAFPLSIRLTPEADPATPTAGAVTAGPWDGYVKAFLSTTTATVPVASTLLETDTANWNQQFIIDASSTVTTTGSAAITVASGGQLQGALIVDLPSAATTLSTRTFRFTATAST